MIRHTILDLLTTLTRPFADAWDQEFGPRPERNNFRDVTKTPTEPPASQGVPETTRNVASAVKVLTPTVNDIVTVAPAEEVPVASDAVIPASPPEPLYVCRGEGKGSRYRVAKPGEPGERFRLLAGGKRKKYQPVR